MADIRLYLTQPSEKGVPPLEGLEDILKRLEHVSEVRAEPAHSVVAVSFEGGHLRAIAQNNRR